MLIKLIDEQAQQALYCRAAFPPYDMKDIKALLVEKLVASQRPDTPHALLDLLPRVAPRTAGSLWRAHPRHPASYTLTADLQEIPVFSWSALYTLAP